MTSGNRRSIPPAVRRVIGFLAPALMATWGIYWATGLFWASLTTGLVMSAGMELAYRLDRLFIAPWLQRISHEWFRFGLETTLSLAEHIVPAILALLACSRVVGFTAEASVAWVVVGGLLIGFPIVHGTESALRSYRELKERERTEERLRALATEAELRALKAQINPHFLFNTLNTIASMIHADPAGAEATVERLSEMFRYVLVGSERGLVPLEEELSFVDGYLEIERARFGQRLSVSREIDDRVLGVPIPSLSLQPLVENAVQHGRGPQGRVELTIRAVREGDEVVISIADQGPGMPSGQGVRPRIGVGLHNVDERLRKTYGEEYRLVTRDNVPRGTVVVVRIPIAGS